MSEKDENLCKFLIVLVLLFKKKNERKSINLQSVQRRRSYKKKRFWVNPIFYNRDISGDFSNLYQELLNDREKFFNYTRMSFTQFEELVCWTEESLTKCSFREALPPRLRLLLTLRFLATGDSYSSLSFAFRIGKTTVCNIIREVTEVLWSTMKDEFLTIPDQRYWEEISKDFYQLWNLPNCCGSIDGKHINMKCPANSGTLFFNYKKTYSIILFAVCDARYNFTYVDIGAYGIKSDGGVLSRSQFGKALAENSLNFPSVKALPDTVVPFPYYMVGDEAFPLKENLMRPYSGRNLPPDQITFNKRLSRARRIIENTFGILASRFRIFQRTINGNVETVKSIVKATCVLHNFLRRASFVGNASSNDVVVDSTISTGISSISSNLRLGARNATQEAFSTRDVLCQWIQDHPLLIE